MLCKKKLIKVFPYLVIWSMLNIVLFLSVFVTPMKVMADTGEDLATAPPSWNVSLLSDDYIIPAEYAFFPSPTYSSEVVVNGVAYPMPNIYLTTAPTDQVRITNVGYIDNRMVDMIYTFPTALERYIYRNQDGIIGGISFHYNEDMSASISFAFHGETDRIEDIKLTFLSPAVYQTVGGSYSESMWKKDPIQQMFYRSGNLVGWNDALSDKFHFTRSLTDLIPPTGFNAWLQRQIVLQADLSQSNGFLNFELIRDNTNTGRIFGLGDPLIRTEFSPPFLEGVTNEVDNERLTFFINQVIPSQSVPLETIEWISDLSDIIQVIPDEVEIKGWLGEDISDRFTVSVDSQNRLTVVLKATADLIDQAGQRIQIKVSGGVDSTKDLTSYFETINNERYVAIEAKATAHINMGHSFEQVLQSNEGISKVIWPNRDISVGGVAVSPTSATIDVGATQALTATVSPEDATNKGVMWSSDDPDIATVDSEGVVTGISPGEVTIRVTTVDGGHFAESKITVVEPVVAAELFVEFINENDQVLPGYTVTIQTETGEIVDLTKDTEVNNQLANLEAAGYEIVERPENEAGVEITSPNMTVHYRVKGLLVLVSTPDVLDFRTITYNASLQRVEDPSFNERLVVTDNRSTATDGWYMMAKLSTPMKNEEEKELKNALRYVYEGTELVLGEDSQVVYSTDSSSSVGSYDITDTWGTTPGSNGIKLQIASNDTVYTGEYTGVITWQVMAGQP